MLHRAHAHKLRRELQTPPRERQTPLRSSTDPRKRKRPGATTTPVRLAPVHSAHRFLKVVKRCGCFSLKSEWAGVRARHARSGQPSFPQTYRAQSASVVKKLTTWVVTSAGSAAASVLVLLGCCSPGGLGAMGDAAVLLPRRRALGTGERLLGGRAVCTARG